MRSKIFLKFEIYTKDNMKKEYTEESEISEAAQALGRLGAAATFKKYGVEHYRKMARISNHTVARGTQAPPKNLPNLLLLLLSRLKGLCE